MFTFYKNISKNYFSLIAFVLIFLKITNAQASEAIFSPMDPPVFVLKKDNKTIYLLGTKHAARLDKVLKQPVRDLLSHVTIWMIEHPITNTPYEFKEDEKLGDKQNSLEAALEGGGDEEAYIREILPKKIATTEPLYITINQTQAFDFAQLLKYKLWVADLLLSVDLNLKAMTKNGGGMEYDLMQVIQSQPLYLETTQEIYHIMNQYTEAKNDYIQRIYNTLKTLQKLNLNTFLKLGEYNFNGLLNLPPPTPASQHRNAIWINTIMKAFEALRENQTMLIAVGTGHLTGKQGLLKLLSDQGFTISALNSSAHEVDIPHYMNFY